MAEAMVLGGVRLQERPALLFYYSCSAGAYRRQGGRMSESRLTKGERDFLAHMRKPWWNLVNKRTFYVGFGTETGRNWVPRGRTGAIMASLMRKGLIDFAPKTGRIAKLVRIADKGDGNGD